MKVQIREIRGGKIKTVEKRFADILVKLKTAEYYEVPDVQKQAVYQTKVMVPEPVLSTPLETETEKITLESEEETEDTNDEEPKRRGRPRKNTYETKVMTAEE